MSDLRLAFRRLVRTPVFTLTALLVLALGIAANVYLVSLVRRALDQTPSYREPERVVFIQPGSRREQRAWGPLSPRQLQELQGQSRSLDAWVGVRDAMGQLKGEGTSEPVDVGCLTSRGLGSLGVPFALGTDAASPEDAVLSHGTWVRRFGQDPSVLGRSLWLDGRARRIVGVLREGVNLPFMLARSEVFIPLTFGPGELASRDQAGCWVLARLAPGQSLAAARQELTLLTKAVASPSQLGEGWTLDAQTMTGFAQQRTREGFTAMAILVVFLLLLISANVAGMHLARLGERAQESALRSALGADRASLLRALGLEALLLSLGGAVLGTAGLRLLLLLQSGGKEDLPLDGLMFLVVVLLALVAALVTGLLPAWLGSRADLRTLLSQGASGTLGGGRMRWRKALVVTQVALTTLLLTGAGLAGQALRRMQSMDVGLKPAGVVGLQCTAPQRLDRSGRATYSADLEHFVAAQPGVRSVALASGMPLYQRSDTARFWVEDGSLSTTQASFQHVSAGYFRTLDIALRLGRTFEGSGAGECLVSERMAQALWPGQSPLGRRLKGGASAPWLTVVGVVADHRHNGFDQAPVDQVFTSYLAGGYDFTAVLVRVDGDVASAGQSLAKALKAYRTDLTVDRVESLQAVAEVILRGPRAFQRMLALGGLLAALLSGLGLHATARSLAVQRSREYGLRMALGASRTTLVGSALVESFRQSGLGFAVGQGAALVLALGLASQLQGVRFADLGTLSAVTLAVGLMTLLAALLPALRAARVQPAVALRSDG